MFRYEYLHRWSANLRKRKDLDFEGAARRIRLDHRAVALRKLILRGVRGGGSGHLSSAFSLVEILRVLYDKVLKVDPRNPNWPERDRLILSKGHGCLALYAILADRGFFLPSHLDTFCRSGSILGGHPNSRSVPGVDFSTGSLGHGLSVGVGMALAARLQRRTSRVYVILGDGELGEGSIWEAALAARKHRLENLFAIIDYNKRQSSGPVSEISGLDRLHSKWESFGFQTLEVNGHNPLELEKIFHRECRTGYPTAIICHTVKGKGISRLESEHGSHYLYKATDEVVRELETQLEESACTKPV